MRNTIMEIFTIAASVLLACVWSVFAGSALALAFIFFIDRGTIFQW